MCQYYKQRKFDGQYCEQRIFDVIKFSVTCGRTVVFSGTPVSSTNKTDGHDATEILLKVTLNTIKLTLCQCQLPSFSLLFCSECTTGRYGVNCEYHCDTCVNMMCNDECRKTFEDIKGDTRSRKSNKHRQCNDTQ